MERNSKYINFSSKFNDISNKISINNMKILLISSGYNSMTQNIERNLIIGGYYQTFFLKFSVKENEEMTINIIFDIDPDLIICPFLTRSIPEKIFSKYKCLIVHPGIVGDRGPSSLDWVILKNLSIWGLTILEATKEMDCGDIWNSCYFYLDSNTTKTTLYNKYIIKNSINLIIECIENFKSVTFKPKKLDYKDPSITGRKHETIRQNSKERLIDWTENTDELIKKINAADGHPGVRAKIIFQNKEFTKFLYGVVKENYIKPKKNIKFGEIFARRNEAVAIKTRDGVIWIKQIRDIKTKENPYEFKLPALINLRKSLEYDVEMLEEIPSENYEKDENTFKEISFEINDKIAIMYFNFYNGAMSKMQCLRMKNLLIDFKAKYKNIKVLILAGDVSNWSNGINLNIIQNSHDPKQESWENLLAINDIIKEILETKDKIFISMIRTNAGAGGVFLALAADFIFAEDHIVLNPHYKNMGLFGSELHTFLGMRRIGEERLKNIKENAKPLIIKEAQDLKFIDKLDEESIKLDKQFIFYSNRFEDKVKEFSNLLANSEKFIDILEDKNKKLEKLLDGKSLNFFEELELIEMHEDIFNDRNEYSIKRRNFVLKL